MQSQDRELWGIKIRQETGTGFLNLTDLQEAYTRARIANGWSNKKVGDILAYEENAERIFYLLEKQGIITSSLSDVMQQIKSEGITHYLKNLKVYKTTGARESKALWCDPYIWVLVAMEMNPELYATVVLWLGDKLIMQRIEAGDFCKELNRAISKWKPTGEEYAQVAKMINQMIFGRHEVGIRNSGSREQLKQLTYLETRLAFAVDMGYIKSMNMLYNECRKMWEEKNGKFKIELP